MNSTTAQPSLSELYEFIDKIHAFPVSVGKLLSLAQRHGEPKVADFYRAFPDQVFSDREDLAGRTEQVEIMRGERQDMPQEEFRAPEED